MGKLSAFVYDLFGLDSMEKILTAAGIVTTAIIIFIYILKYSPEKAWSKSIWCFLGCFTVGFAFYNWKWWTAALAAAGEVLLAWRVAALIQEKKRLEEEALEKDFQLWQTQQLQKAALRDRTEETPPTIKPYKQPEEADEQNDVPAPTVPAKEPVEQTLLSCMRCGQKLSGAVCSHCRYDNRKKIRLLAGTDPRKLQIKE